ncbi:hypothetical protein TrVE_jg200 [Triparma verrucosa]|uniref:Uncharacterized protein n=1 Tax=Triparma verrucosa TaxID=1606542 RepID=A0A9W7CIP6_9STRA|nr:hypothetical protein TrVE_jg200 [Triparma verrucosa]
MSPPSSFQLVPHIVHNNAAFHAAFHAHYNGQKISGSSTISRCSSLYAKKRKRKNSYNDDNNDDYNDDDDIALKGLTEEEESIVKSLPDFVLPSLQEEKTSSDAPSTLSPPASSQPVPSRSTTVSSLPPRDLSLESTFTFDAVSTPLPKPQQLLNKKRKKKINTDVDNDTRSYAERFGPSSSSPPPPSLNPIEKLRELVTPKTSPEKKEINYLKILENSTWVGIGLLVLWEVYINSPLFERAAPMAPIVY